ncbi:phytoene desaturase [Rhodoligotrophos appendicifer]|uniref:phytoene desaturase family protein n=1 Tax=Rhodoligotrophos appendicifer TaxID=987056 RepID=UPI001184CAE0|nr:phytoene desaturase family protein [Rhodoligotrophos appendicifer]
MKAETARSVAVVGAGLGGLAAACTLAARGHSVTVFDKNEWIGGKAAVLQENGYRFDMGPTILTVPGVLYRIFSEAGKKLEDYLELVRLDPQWRCFFEDGSVLDLVENVEQMSGNIQTYTGDSRSSEGYKQFIKLSERLHDVSNRFFFWKSVEDLKDTIDFRRNLDAKTLSDVMALKMGSTVASQIRRKVPDERVAQMLDHFTQYVGSSPYSSPAVLCSIAHMQTELGVWYPMGGTRAVPVALEKLATELGVKFRLSTNVNRIAQENGKVLGIVTDTGERLSFDRVVSNMDAVRTYAELVGGDIGAKFTEAKKYEPACSGVVLYLGLKKAYEHILHHCFVFSRDPEEEFQAIYHDGEPAPDPTCYLAATSRTEKGVAPEGGEALYVLVHTPYLRPHHDWSKMLPQYRAVILDKLKRCAGMPDIEERIEFEAALTPQSIHDRYKVLNGAIYGLASHGRFLGAFKPGNRSRQVEGLYLAGGAAHPGPGMPMVMMSGWIAADSLDQDAKAKVAA